MKIAHTWFSLIVIFLCVSAKADYNTRCHSYGNSVYCDTYEYHHPEPYLPKISNDNDIENSFLSGFNAGMEARKNAIEIQNALLQQQILLRQAQQMERRERQPKIASCQIDKIVGKEFLVGRVELVLTRIASDKYQIVGTDAYVLTKDCFRYMKNQSVIADINHSPSDKIYFE